MLICDIYELKYEQELKMVKPVNLYSIGLTWKLVYVCLPVSTDAI